MAPRGNGIRVHVTRRNMNDGFLITPNDLFRGTGTFHGLSPYARVVLGAGLSCKDGYDTNLDEIEAWLPGIGRNRQEAVRRELRERGFLSQTANRIPAGRPDAGRYEWSFAFYMDPLPETERDPLQPKTATRKPAGQAVPRDPGHGPGVDETAGQTEPRFSGHGHPGHGSPGLRPPGPRDSGLSSKEEKDHPLQKNQGLEEPEDREEPTPPTPAEPASPDPVDADGGTGPDSDTAQQPIAAKVLDDVLDAAQVPRARRPGHAARLSLVEALTAKLDEGWHPLRLVDALSGSYDTAGIVARVMRARIGELCETPPPPPAARPAPAPAPRREPCTVEGCDTRFGGRGMIETPDGTVKRCPTCLPSPARQPEYAAAAS